MTTFVEPEAVGTVARKATRPPRVYRTALQLDEETTWEGWRAVGARISAHADASNWWLGDWLLFGEAHYSTRYASAIESSGLEYKTLRNYAMVSRRFRLSRRRVTLSFAHHAEVCALDDAGQEHWLDLAQEHRWSKVELRRQMRASKPQSVTDAATLRLSVAADHTERWRQAARSLGYEFEEWAVLTLDAAAHTVIAAQ